MLMVTKALRLMLIGIGCSSLALTEAAAAEVAPAALAGACTACHGPQGHSPGEIPSIDKLTAASIRDSLLGYKRDDVKVTVMNRIAKGFSESEIGAIAGFYGKTTP